MSSSRAADFRPLAERVRTLQPRECACGEQVDYVAPGGEFVCLTCAPKALANGESWDALRALSSDERYVVDGDADA